METLVPKEHYNYLYKTSFLTLSSVLYSIYRGHYHITIYPTGILLTSLNYWRYPLNDWRRTTDIIVVVSSISQHVIVAYTAENGTYFYYLLALSILFYFVGHYLYNKHLWASTIAHSMLHVFLNVAALVLYAGEL